MTMTRLRRMASPSLERPLIPPNTLDDLRARSRRRRQHYRVGVGGVFASVVLVIVVVTQVLPTSTGSSVGTARLAGYIVKGVSVPDSVLERIGLPTGGPINTTSLLGQPPLIDGGRPAVVYVGAEFCPYCSVQRWALLVALSRFGSFSNLGQIIRSSSTEVDPDLQSWSFHGSSYTSTYLTFDPAEIETSTHVSTPDSGYTPLDRLSPLQKQVYDTYDAGGGFPWIDFGNKIQMLGPSADPAVLEGLNLDQIASDLSDPSSPVAQAIDGAANYMIAKICSIGSSINVPICSAPFVAQAEAQISGQTPGSTP